MNVERSTVLRTSGKAGDAARGAPGDGTFDVVRAADGAAWGAALAQAVQHDFHHLAGYHRLAEHKGEGEALLFAYRERGYLIALPLLVRPVDDGDPAGLRDATSVYGYAGPVASHARIPRRIVEAFQAALRDELARRRVISVFSRLHPLIPQQHLLEGLGETRLSGLTVSIDLTLPLEEQWAGYSKVTRRLIRRAQEAGIICVHDRELTCLGEWAAIYRETMERVGASSSYDFDEADFELLAAELGPVLQLFVAFVDGRATAAGLFTICDGIVQAHLGGSRMEHADLSPTRLVDDTARRWAFEAGARVLHLGGGVGGREDSLFRYKAGFSDRRHRFTTWRWVVDAAAYRELCELRVRGNGRDAACDGGEAFFPCYRRPLEAGP
jgi:hypothetical protein